MAITYHGLASVPTQNGSNGVSPTVITPPASMSAGDLVIVVCGNRLNADTHAVSATGGQSWTKLTTESSQALVSSTWFWCIFNGTWTTSPSFSHGGTNNTCIMLVFRPTAGKIWAADVTEAPAGFAAPSSPYDITITGITAAAASVAIASWFSRDDNDWALQSGANWVQPSGGTVSNLAGSDTGMLVAYKLMPSGGSTGDPVGREVAVGGDAGSQNIASFKEITSGATLVMNDAFHGLISDSPVLIQAHVLVSIDAFHGLISDVPTLTQKHILVVVDTVHSHSSDGDLVLTQKSTLVVNETVHSNSADEPVLTQKHTLTVNDTAHGHTTENIVLIQSHVLSINETAHSHTADNIDLTYSEGVELVMQDAFHGLTSDVPVLIQVHTLIISDTAHLHSSDATILTQKHTLVVNDTLHGLISDNITLDYSESVELVVSDCFHGLTSDEPVLTQSHVLTVNDTAHAQIVDEPVLTQKHALVPLDAFHTQTADGDLILVESGGSTVLVVQDAVHELTSDVPLLTQKHTLSVNDSAHSQTVDLIILNLITLNLKINIIQTPVIATGIM